LKKIKLFPDYPRTTSPQALTDFNIMWHYMQRSCHIITLCINSEARLNGRAGYTLRCLQRLVFPRSCVCYLPPVGWLILKDNIKNAYALLLFYFSYYLLKRFVVAPRGGTSVKKIFSEYF
jgi:hypothetical protein